MHGPGAPGQRRQRARALEGALEARLQALHAPLELLRRARERLAGPGDLAVGQRAGRAERGDRVGEQVEHEERADRADVDAADGRHDAAEEVEVDVGDGEDRLEHRDALSLREPGEQDAQRDQALEDAQE
eukprot:4235343-Prymnesium_polylepis.1